MKAYRIVDWWSFEILKNGKLATAKTKMGALRIKPLVYVRFPVHGHSLSADYRRMVRVAGPEMAATCDGIYKMLVGLAGNQVREYRGWVLDDRQQPLDPEKVAELLSLSEEKTSQALEILTDDVVRWVTLEEFPEHLHKSLKSSDLSGVSQIKNFGNNREKKGSPLIETETEKGKGKFFDSSEGVPVKENFEQPQPPGQSSAPVPVPGSAAVSASEKPTVSGPATVSDTDPVSQTGRAAGAAVSEPLTAKDKLFEIRRECKKACLELSQIIRPRNNSDTTTISDIYSQLQQRLIAGSPYPLFELSLNTARQCWRADKPIAMFVAAMKKPPFYYVPKKLSVVPGKFRRGKNNR